ncbi:class I SAM-dependent methyltransferase [Patescibacteria group bacterium]|nr:class I SAM-dependent methyltransferase [Patescibacteria group bacterium]
MEFLNPQEVLNQLELEGDMIAADFGSGSGGWAIPLAKRLKFGRVYAIDILEEPLSALKSKGEIERVFNIETVRSNVEAKQGSKLADSFCDLVLITNLLFEAKDKKIIMDEAKRALKKKGKILVVDWFPEAPLGPKEGRVSAADVKKIAQDLNLKLEKEFKAGAYHYGLIFIKP